MKSIIKEKNKWLVKVLMIVAVCIFFIWQNNGLTTSEITFESDKIPEAFKGYKIVHLSDLHNKTFGREQKNLLKKIQKIDPDIIVITGDLIDSKDRDSDAAMALIDGVVDIAPIYYVSGNHEAWSGQYDILKTKLEQHGVVVLDNEMTKVFKDGAAIEIIGITDPAFMQLGDEGEVETILTSLIEDNNHFKILLSHRPELFDVYASTPIDLVFSGHAHGGQFRLPFIGGIVAPDQGFLPELTEGIHTRYNTSLVISRGLGNSVVPIRLLNRPEIVVMTLSR